MISVVGQDFESGQMASGKNLRGARSSTLLVSQRQFARGELGVGRCTQRAVLDAAGRIAVA